MLRLSSRPLLVVCIPPRYDMYLYVLLLEKYLLVLERFVFGDLSSLPLHLSPDTRLPEAQHPLAPRALSTPLSIRAFVSLPTVKLLK